MPLVVGCDQVSSICLASPLKEKSIPALVPGNQLLATAISEVARATTKSFANDNFILAVYADELVR